MADPRTHVVVAMPVHQGRISPMFEAARHLLVTELAQRRECSRQEVCLGPRSLVTWLEAVIGSGAELLVCGAISNSSLWHLGRHGLQVWPGFVGDVDELIRTLAGTGTLSEAFAMPGTRHGPVDRRLWPTKKAVRQ